NYTGTITFFLELIGITLVVGILSGSYPAIFLSKFQPAQSVRGSIPLKAKGFFLKKDFSCISVFNCCCSDDMHCRCLQPDEFYYA
ncbi:MAG: hypothetical protein WBV81_24210, partial [Ignavibacteriaceae bacterium]